MADHQKERQHHQRSQFPPRSDSPASDAPTTPPKHTLFRRFFGSGLVTPSRVLLLHSRLQRGLAARPIAQAALFLLYFGLHTLLCPLSTAGSAAETGKVAQLLLLWSTFALLIAGPWCTANVLVPLWLALGFLKLLPHPRTSAAVPLLWGLSVWSWLSTESVRGYASAEWVAVAETQDLRQRLQRLQAAAISFSSQTLGWLLSSEDNDNNKLVGREPHAAVQHPTLWTPAQLRILRPVPVDARKLPFLAAAKRAVGTLRADMDTLLREGDRYLEGEEELVVERGRLKVLVDTTVDIWEGLYAELMHPQGKGETRRPEVGEKLPTRIFMAVKWFLAVEENGIEVIFVERPPATRSELEDRL